MTYTPGPWYFIDQIEHTGQSIYTVGYVDETGERTYDVRFIPPVSDWATAHANAHLISAAPQLLEALSEMVILMDNNNEPGAGSEWHRKASRAVAKARGGRLIA